MLMFHALRAKAALVCLALFVTFAVAENSRAQRTFEMPPEPDSSRAIYGVPDALTFGTPALDSGAARPAGAEVDPGFAPVLDNAYGFVTAIEQQPNGKVLVGGGFKSVNGYATSCMLRLNADRTIDTTFKSTIRGQVNRIIVLPDEKIIIGGLFTAFSATTSRSGIARLNSDGSLDTTFQTGAGPGGNIRDIRLQADGKILIAGEFLSFDGAPRAGLARLNSDGSLDASFTSPFGVQFPMPFGSPPQVGVLAVGIQPDGKVIVAGFMQFPGDSPGVRRAVVRLNNDGSIDGSFNMPTMGGSNPSELDIQPDGKIVVVGFFTSVNSVSRNRVARLNADGTLDTTFDPGTGSNTSIQFVRVLKSGQVLITGGFTAVNGVPRGGVALLNSNGSLNTTFAPGTTSGTIGAALPIPGGYYVGGSFGRIAGVDDRNTLAALDANGTVDPGFVATSYTHPTVRTIAIQPDGKIIAGGSFNRINGVSRTSLVRFNANGTPDLTFDSGQLIAVSVYRIVFQPDGKILVMGSGLVVNGGPGQMMVRLNADGTVDNTFSLATIPQITIGLAAAVQPDGKILFSFVTTATNPTSNAGFVRLNSDGSLDASFTNNFPNARFEALAVLPNGQILAAGPFGFAYVSSGSGSEPHAAVIRINSDGSHDRAFRSGLTFDDSNISAAYAMHLQSDGRIVVGGRLFTAASPNPIGVVRLNASGTIDGSFQTNAISSIWGLAHVFALEPTTNGKFLAGGFFDVYGGTPRANLVRLEANGAVDATFTSGTDYTVNAVKTASNGSIVIGGSFEKVNGIPRTAIARLLDGPARRAPFDFDGDGKTDIGISRANGGVAEWWINNSSTGSTLALQFGASTDVIAPADYTGDGKADIAFFRPSTGEWYVLRSDDFSFFAFPFGANGDVPVPADYDADGKADFALFRPSSSTWFISQSSGAPTQIFQFGVTGDVPVVADYDGDGKADVGIFRQGAGGAEWWINRSTAGSLAMQFGSNTDKPVQGDYTGDGKADIAVWQQATGQWLIVRSEDFSFYGFPFGASGDVVAPGDYDGDGKFDATVFRPSAATWFIARSTAGTQIVQFGANGDRPLPNSFVP